MYSQLQFTNANTANNVVTHLASTRGRWHIISYKKDQIFNNLIYKTNPNPNTKTCSPCYVMHVRILYTCTCAICEWLETTLNLVISLSLLAFSGSRVGCRDVNPKTVQSRTRTHLVFKRCSPMPWISFFCCLASFSQSMLIHQPGRIGLGTRDKVVYRGDQNVG